MNYLIIKFFVCCFFFMTSLFMFNLWCVNVHQNHHLLVDALNTIFVSASNCRFDNDNDNNDDWPDISFFLSFFPFF